MPRIPKHGSIFGGLKSITLNFWVRVSYLCSIVVVVVVVVVVTSSSSSSGCSGAVVQLVEYRTRNQEVAGSDSHPVHCKQP